VLQQRLTQLHRAAGQHEFQHSHLFRISIVFASF
jgi:hypothetical protein